MLLFWLSSLSCHPALPPSEASITVTAEGVGASQKPCRGKDAPMPREGIWETLLASHLHQSSLLCGVPSCSFLHPSPCQPWQHAQHPCLWVDHGAGRPSSADTNLKHHPSALTSLSRCPPPAQLLHLFYLLVPPRRCCISALTPATL